ncbi:MAG: hypothetical protein A3I68_02355 [Candidatus Melainabacteria bacterium RIFCSPLOWO2_02_FULL_35_15]|nr:MAG: hypothetical protein A3I68_02355 [Candidatus Melainabacteria bacterium RIFCSPLOWO2_02_FULL_35_15]
MKLYLDENISPLVAKKLREKGFDVISVHENNTRSKSDIEQFELAIREKRAIVTYDVIDFTDLAKGYIAKVKPHSGIILVSNKTIPQGNSKKLAVSLEKLLHHKEKDFLENRIVYLTK